MLSEHITTLRDRPQFPDWQFPVRVLRPEELQVAVGILRWVQSFQPRLLILVDEITSLEQRVRVLFLLGLDEVQPASPALRNKLGIVQIQRTEEPARHDLPGFLPEVHLCRQPQSDHLPNIFLVWKGLCSYRLVMLVLRPYLRLDSTLTQEPDQWVAFVNLCLRFARGHGIAAKPRQQFRRGRRRGLRGGRNGSCC